jgi:uncharacterized phage protein gp47/JayE
VSLPVQTTQAIADNIVAQIEAEISQTVPLLPKAFVRVLAKAEAGVYVLLYKYAGFIFLQMFVAHATMQEVTINGKKIRPLVEWGRLVGVGDPYAATRAELKIAVKVTNLTGTLAAGAHVVRTETGVIYQVVAPVPLNASVVTATIRAVSDQRGGNGAGAIGNLLVGDVLSFANPLPNIATNATVSAVLVNGANAEPTEAYRARVIRRFQRRPQGGAHADYQLWAEEVPGIINAYPYSGELDGRPGEVDVFCEATPESSGNADGEPTPAQLAAVLASINLEVGGKASRRPIGAAVTARPITRQDFTVTVTGLTPETGEVKDAIESAVSEYMLSREPYIEGLSTLPRRDVVTQGAVSGVVDDVTSAFGASYTSVTITPGPVRQLGHGQKAKLTPGYPNFV